MSKLNYVVNSDENFKSESYFEFLKNSASYIKSKVNFEPEIVITLGSGLSGLVNEIDVVGEVPFSEIEGFPVTTNKMHAGSFVLGYLGGKKVICLNGRLHYYEGYKMQDVVAPLRVCKLLGAKSFIVTCATGAINPNFQIGDFMAHNDIITQFVPSSMIGPNIDDLGERFFDMTDIFDSHYLEIAHKIADENGITLHDGTHVQTTGPQYETPSDVKLLGHLGADTVGMSTICEEIAARHMGMKILGISFVSNMAAGISKVALSDDDVCEASKTHGQNFIKLIKGIVENI